jgi:glycosyltransferase involved in cell wall biosynthesis
MKISVCLATYNGEKFIIRQLDSVLKQIGENDEVIVIDDCSKDRTTSLIKENYGPSVQVIVNENNLGAMKSFEKAISIAKGDILFLCDQDDIWLDQKVERVMEEFEKRRADLVVHDAEVVDGNLDLMDSSWNRYNRNDVNQGLVGNVMKNAFTGAMMAFRKELVPLFLPLPASIEMHDQWIAIVAMLHKKRIVTIDEPLMQYVRHGGNVTGMRKRSKTEQIKGRLGTISSIFSYKLGK